MILIVRIYLYFKKRRFHYFVQLSISIFCLGPPHWSSGQSSWLQIHRSEFNSLCYQIFCEVVGLERSPFSLMSTIEELLGGKSSGFGVENRQ
jgi:hypothetical protein